MTLKIEETNTKINKNDFEKLTKNYTKIDKNDTEN